MSSPAVNVNPRLAALLEAGVSPWLDLLRRSLVESGELQRMIEEESLRGATSNPAIFEKAILGSDDYDDQLEQLAADGADGRETYRAMVVRDVQSACDVFRPVWEQSEHEDGYVSLEVEPDLANDTEGTLTAARYYWERVDRPNVMIKIPGTPEGVQAIEEATYEGINVNVTLLFAVSAYRAIAEAYIRGMRRRADEGKSLDVHSVASFFVSRVDTEVDKRLDKLGGHDDLKGLAGIANARAAYRLYLDELRPQMVEIGAPVQRPLWASTGVKDPRYPDTMYVDGLIAPETINTMPLDTLLAVGDHGTIEPRTAERDATDDLRRLKDAGIDLDDVTDQLLTEGIAKFVTPMIKLMAGIESKREAIVTNRPRTFDSNLPDDLEQAVRARIDRAVEDDVARRVWQKDPTLWGGDADTPELSDRLGWLTVAERMQEELQDLQQFASEIQGAGITHALLLGMGGSSLAPEVFRRSFGAGDIALHVLDSTHPDAIRAAEQAIDLDRTLFIVSSKSGGTIETLSHFKYFWERTGGAGERFVAITDPGSPLAQLGADRGFRRVFEADPEIGGRYSALSHFGIVPAVLMGADVEALLDGAQVAAEGCRPDDPGAHNSGLWLGATLGELATRGRDKLTFVVDDPQIASVGLWLEQLVAESTGKHGRGILPVAGEPVGSPEQYGEDRVFVHLRGEGAELDDAVGGLAHAGHAVLTIPTQGAKDLGRIFFFAEFATAVAGWALELNPFDQPNVQEAKDNTKQVLDSGLPDIPTGRLEDVTDGAAPPSYVAFMAYVPPSDAVDAKLEALRRRVRDATRATTTFGYGPRFLHSTGQFHKGGPATGRFVQLVDDISADLDVPGEPYSFGTLIGAQAAGDYRTLEAHGLTVVRVKLDEVI